MSAVVVPVGPAAGLDTAAKSPRSAWEAAPAAPTKTAAAYDQEDAAGPAVTEGPIPSTAWTVPRLVKIIALVTVVVLAVGLGVGLGLWLGLGKSSSSDQDPAASSNPASSNPASSNPASSNPASSNPASSSSSASGSGASTSSSLQPPPPPPSPPAPPIPNTLLWADEFSGTALDRSSWMYSTGDGTAYAMQGFGNGELQCYTNSSANLGIVPDPDNSTNGLLAITAIYQLNKPCYNRQYPLDYIFFPNTSRSWTSANVFTTGKRSFVPNATAGIRVDIRAKVPMGQGTWPVLWMLPEPNSYGGWCSSGEIDIMEHINTELSFHGTLHYGGNPGNSGTNCTAQGSTYSTGITASTVTDWHTHSVMWTLGYIAFLVDGVEHRRVSSSLWWSGNGLGVPSAPYNKPFHLIMQLSMGGSWPGAPVAGSGPYTMLVDWLKVFSVPL